MKLTIDTKEAHTDLDALINKAKILRGMHTEEADALAKALDGKIAELIKMGRSAVPGAINEA